MLKRVLIVVVVIAAIIGGWELYSRNAARNGLGSGDVYSTDSSKSSDSGNTDLDGRPAGTVAPTPSRSGDPVTGSGTTSNQPPPSMKAPIASSNPSASVVPTPFPASTPASLPVSDTVAPNAPNGLAFGGTGKFQWYRQGNLTWRVNTASGSTCIAFATMEEWQKPLVYRHGCGNA